MAADTGRLLAEVQSMLGDAPRVSARIVGDKVVLEGSEVSEALAGRIGEIGKRFPQVVNLLPRIGMERMIAMDVKFVEIRRELLQDIGIKWNASAQGPSFQVIGDAWRSPALRPGGAADGTALEIRPRIWPFASSLSITSSLASMINLLVQNGDAVVLAEPRLSCRSGGSARFIAGGELPIPITGALGTASVAFKEYGIKFDVSPVASESGVIAARIATEISSINFEVTVKDVPVDGFWSITMYDANGFMFENEQKAYSLNNVTAKPAADGSVSIQFGGDPKTASNFLPVAPGWNYIVRLYRPKKDILDGTWKFPEAQPME
jgi:pilus assembly protein CpaC